MVSHQRVFCFYNIGILVDFDSPYWVTISTYRSLFDIQRFVISQTMIHNIVIVVDIERHWKLIVTSEELMTLTVVHIERHLELSASSMDRSFVNIWEFEIQSMFGYQTACRIYYTRIDVNIENLQKLIATSIDRSFLQIWEFNIYKQCWAINAASEFRTLTPSLILSCMNYTLLHQSIDCSEKNWGLRFNKLSRHHIFWISSTSS